MQEENALRLKVLEAAERVGRNMDVWVFPVVGDNVINREATLEKPNQLNML